jgi:hypothetical protein
MSRTPRIFFTLTTLVLATLFFNQALAQIPFYTFLESEERIESIEEAAEPQAVEGFDLTRQYNLVVINEDGTTAPVTLWLAKNEGQDYASFVSVGYNGTFDGAGLEAVGYIKDVATIVCLGIDDETRSAITEFSISLFTQMPEEWTSDTQQFGDYKATTGMAFTPDTENAELLIDIEALGVPGENGWETTCALE